MKLSQIEQVLEVARAGSISKAAENLYESQPTLSLSIKKLEEEIGADLFVRSGGGVTLTHFGERFVAQAKNIMTEVEILQELCRSRKNSQALQLRIGSQGSFSFPRFFAELLKKYEKYPIEISWFDMGLDEQLDALKDGEIDAGILTIWDYKRRGTQRKIRAKELDYRRIAPTEIGIFVSPEDAAFAGRRGAVTPEDLEQKPLVLLEGQQKLLPYLRQLRQHGFALPENGKVIHTADLGTVREAVRAVQGYFISTDCSALHPEGNPFSDVVFLPLELEGVSAEVGCILNPQRPRSLLAEELIADLTMYTC